MTQDIEQNLKKLGIELPTAPSPAANYVPFVIVGNFLYVSGQISQNKNGLIIGKLGENLNVEEFVSLLPEASSPFLLSTTYLESILFFKNGTPFTPFLPFPGEFDLSSPFAGVRIDLSNAAFLADSVFPENDWTSAKRNK